MYLQISSPHWSSTGLTLGLLLWVLFAGLLIPLLWGKQILWCDQPYCPITKLRNNLTPNLSMCTAEIAQPNSPWIWIRAVSYCLHCLIEFANKCFKNAVSTNATALKTTEPLPTETAIWGRVGSFLKKHENGVVKLIICIPPSLLLGSPLGFPMGHIQCHCQCQPLQPWLSHYKSALVPPLPVKSKWDTCRLLKPWSAALSLTQQGEWSWHRPVDSSCFGHEWCPWFGWALLPENLLGFLLEVPHGDKQGHYQNRLIMLRPPFHVWYQIANPHSTSARLEVQASSKNLENTSHSKIWS